MSIVLEDSRGHNEYLCSYFMPNKLLFIQPVIDLILTGTQTTDCCFPAGVKTSFKAISGKGSVYSDRLLSEICGLG